MDCTNVTNQKRQRENGGAVEDPTISKNRARMSRLERELHRKLERTRSTGPKDVRCPLRWLEGNDVPRSSTVVRGRKNVVRGFRKFRYIEEVEHLADDIESDGLGEMERLCKPKVLREHGVPANRSSDRQFGKRAQWCAKRI